MPKICYRGKIFSIKSKLLIDQALQIIEEYEEQGFDLTLRQLYYQFVSRDLIPNKVAEYNRLGNIVSDARIAGLIDWNSIVDRTRELKSLGHWENPREIIESAIYSFHIDKWEEQEFQVEVWIEKEALAGVISGICRELDIPYFSCKGYTSQSEMWKTGQRLIAHQYKGKTPIILHLGDHDPSGIDMTRDIKDRLELFTYGVIEVKRIALNLDQIKAYKPPPNPAKVTDTRAKAYIYEFGDNSWELDALEPSVLVSLIKDHTKHLRDEDLWLKAVKKEELYKEDLRQIADNWK